jgi:hypothetical protein
MKRNVQNTVKAVFLVLAVAALSVACDLHAIVNPIQGEWMTSGDTGSYTFEETIVFGPRHAFEVSGVVVDPSTNEQFSFSGSGDYETSDGDLFITATLDENETPNLDDVYLFVGSYSTLTKSTDNELYLELQTAEGTVIEYVKQ